MSAPWLGGVLRANREAAAATVVKFGGSLLLRPSWPAELRAVVAECPDPATVVVGGGALVDALRAIDAAIAVEAEMMHRLAIDAMRITARLTAETTGLPLAATPSAGREAVVLDAAAWLAQAGRLATLPVGWHVTSDSIAAAVAAACGGRLLLVKSVPPPGGDDLLALARQGWIDEHFPVAAAAVARIEWAAPATISPTSSR